MAKSILHFIQINFLLLLMVVGLFGCDYKERENEILKKTEALNQREQDLLLREKNLQLKEDSLNRLLQRPTADSLVVVDTLPNFILGAWNAKMVCTETNCPNSAIGDIQSANWEFTSRDSAVVITSFNPGQINRIYTGHYFANNTIKASLQALSTEQQTLQSRLVEITEIKDNKMRGVRTVTQPDGCRIVYSLELDKKP